MEHIPLAQSLAARVQTALAYLILVGSVGVAERLKAQEGAAAVDSVMVEIVTTRFYWQSAWPDEFDYVYDEIPVEATLSGWLKSESNGDEVPVGTNSVAELSPPAEGELLSGRAGKNGALYGEIRKFTLEVGKPITIKLARNGPQYIPEYINNEENETASAMDVGQLIKPSDCRDNLWIRWLSAEVFGGETYERQPVNDDYAPYYGPDISMGMRRIYAGYWRQLACYGGWPVCTKEDCEFGMYGYYWDMDCEYAGHPCRHKLDAEATFVLDREVGVGNVWCREGASGPGDGSSPSGVSSGGSFSIDISATPFLLGPSFRFSIDSTSNLSSLEATVVGMMSGDGFDNYTTGSYTDGSSVSHQILMTRQNFLDIQKSGNVTTIRSGGTPSSIRDMPTLPLPSATGIGAILAGAPLNMVATLTKADVSGGTQLTVTYENSGGTEHLIRRSGSVGLSVSSGTHAELTKKETKYETATLGGLAAGTIVTEIWRGGDAPNLILNRSGVYAPTALTPLSGRLAFNESPSGSRTEYSYAIGSYDIATGVFTVSPTNEGDYLRVIATIGRYDDGVAAFLVPNKSTRRTTVSPLTDESRNLSEFLEIYDGSLWHVATTINRSFTADGYLISQRQDGNILYSADWLEGRKIAETDAEGSVVEFSEFNSSDEPMRLTRKGVVGTSEYPIQVDRITDISELSGVRTELETGGADSRVNESGNSGSTRWFTQQGLTTTYSGNLTTYPSGATSDSTVNGDGQLQNVTGTSVTPQYHTYTTSPTTGHKTHTTYYGDAYSPTANYVAVTTDTLGRKIKEERPSYLTATTSGTHIRTYHYSPTTGQLVRETATGMADYIYQYDDFGRLWRTGHDLSPATPDGDLTAASTDTITQSETTYEYDSSSSAWYRVATRSLARLNDSDALSVESIHKERVTLASGILAQSIDIDQAGQVTTYLREVNRAAALVTETTAYPGATSPEVRITRNGLLQSVKKPHQASPIKYTYDGLGRQNTITDPALGTVIDYDYNDDDQIETITTRSADSSLSVVETLEYHQQGDLGAGQISRRVTAGRETNFAYDARGNVVRQWGNSYPVRYEYDGFGRMEKLHTYRDASSVDFDTVNWAGGSPDTTTWAYHPATGQLLSKTDAANRAVSYSYYPSGLPHVRTWQRGVTTTYVYDAIGRTQNIQYSDGTPNVGIGWHRDGRVNTLTDAAGQRTFSYDSSFRRSGESYSEPGLLEDLTILNPMDAQRRPSAAIVKRQGVELHRYDYSYLATSGLLDKVQSGAKVADYAYSSDSAWVDHISFLPAGTTESIRQTRTPDALGRLHAIKTERYLGASPQNLASHTYGYNANNRRETATLADGLSWLYDYDDYDQVTDAKKRRVDGTTVLPGYDFGYTFDDIGNRTATAANGQSVTYTPNVLNQYENRTVPDSIDVRGRAGANATVTVNGASVTRTGMEFHKQHELRAASNDNAVSSSITVQATHADPAQTITQTRPAFLPATPEDYDYDLDGNLTKDGAWSYTWDAENRLIAMESVSAVSSAQKRRLEFAYDAQGRRISKVVSIPGTTPPWAPVETVRFVYDGWNLLAELQPATGTDYTVLRSYVWGLDLSGTTQGAGGVGGLLWAQIGGNSHVAGYDGNGNITAWLDMATGYLTGQRDCAAFGEPVQVAGVSGQIPFGFSSKYQDAETGFNYYGFRYYNPSIGRWLSRDPIAEGGGVAIYAMTENDTINKIDILGLYPGVPGHGNPVSPIEAHAEILRLQNIGDVNFNQLLHSYLNHFGADIVWRQSGMRNAYRFSTIIGRGINSTPNGRLNTNASNKFVYTCRYGWIDMGHFFRNANLAYTFRDSLVEAAATGLEVAQSAYGSDSSFSVEDLQSNARGRDFGAHIRSLDNEVMEDSMNVANIHRLIQQGKPPIMPVYSFANIANEWHIFLRNAGAIRWGTGVTIDGKTVEQYIQDDLAAYRQASDGNGNFTDWPFAGTRPSATSASAGLEWQKDRPLWQCLCGGDRPKNENLRY